MPEMEGGVRPGLPYRLATRFDDRDPRARVEVPALLLPELLRVVRMSHGDEADLLVTRQKPPCVIAEVVRFDQLEARQQPSQKVRENRHQYRAEGLADGLRQ